MTEIHDLLHVYEQQQGMTFNTFVFVGGLGVKCEILKIKWQK
jgi:hypothetical protein